MVMALQNRRIPLLRKKLATWEQLMALPGMAIALRADRGVYTDGAAQFTSANKEYLSRTDSFALQTGSWTIGGWFYRDSTGASHQLFSHWQASSNVRAVNIQVQSADDKLAFIVSADGTTTPATASPNLVTTSAKWYCWICRHNSGSNIVARIRAADASSWTEATTAHTDGIFNSSVAVMVGAILPDAPTNFMNGRLDSIFVLKRATTDAEDDALFNNGKGVSWDEVEAGGGDLGTFYATMIGDTTNQAWWELDEADGLTRADSNGANDLTPTGAELAVNGGFAADTDWTKGTNWSIAAGVATAATATSDLEQTVTGNVQSGKKYQVVFDVTVATSGSVRPDVGGTGGTSRSTVATFTETILGGSANELIEFKAQAFDGSIDNVSIISLGPSWAVGVQSTGQVNDDDDIVGTWESQKGGHLFQQATLSKRPTWKINIFGTKPGVLFDGTDDLLVKASAILTGTKGYVIALVQLSASPSEFQGLLSSSDEGTATSYWETEAYNQAATPNIAYYQRDAADMEDAVRGSTTIAAATSYIIVLQSNGAVGGLTFRVNRADETETRFNGADPYNGDWVGDTTLRDNTVIGALKRTTEADFLKGYLGVLLVGDGATLTQAQLLDVARWLNTWAGGGVL